MLQQSLVFLLVSQEALLKCHLSKAKHVHVSESSFHTPKPGMGSKIL